MSLPDYYEFLQISPNAEADTIHRVHKYLAMRFHPDNPQTSDPDKFHLLQRAYEVLSDERRRMEYNAARRIPDGGTAPLSSSVDFMDNTAGELNRRLAVLALLYLRRRACPNEPTVSLFDIEARMGFPREYLDFTLWYLQRKGYITRADNGEASLTADGVDFVETQRHGFPVLNRLLTSGDGSVVTELREHGHDAAWMPSRQTMRPVPVPNPAPNPGPIVVGPDRRSGERRRGDRRAERFVNHMGQLASGN
jgi:curved DNA-binding protein